MSNTPIPLKKPLTFVMWPLCLLLPTIIGLLLGGELADQAYNPLRYAQNISAGRGVLFDSLVVGASEPFTSPLFVALLSVLGGLGLPMSTGAMVLSGLGWGLIALAIYRFGFITNRPFTTFVVPLLLIFNPLVLTMSGTADSAAVGLAWLAILLVTKRKTGQKRTIWLLTAVLSLLLLTHFDLVVILLVFAVWMTLAKENELTVGVPLLCVCVGMALLMWWLKLPFAVQMPNFFGWPETGQQIGLYQILPLFIGLGLFVKNRILQRFEIIDLLLVWPVIAFFAQSQLAETALMVATLLLVGLGVDGLIGRLEQEERTRFTAQQLLLSFGILIGLPLVVVQASSIWHSYQLHPNARLDAEQEAAEWLQQHSSEMAVVIASPRFGYLADRPLQYPNGLNDLNGAASLPLFLNQVMQQPPDYLITFRSPDWLYVTQTGWFQETFTVANRFENARDVGTPLTLWQRSPSLFADAPTTPISVTTGNGIDLVSYRVEPRQISPGDAVRVQLDWRATRPMSETVQTVVRIVSPHDRVAWAQRDRVTPRSLPSDWLQPGIVFPESFVLTTTLEIPVGAYLLTASLHNPDEEEFLTLYQGEDPNPLDRATLGYVVVPWAGEVADTAVPIEALFGEQIQLLSCDCADMGVAGGEINLTLYWEALQPPDDNYIVFIHLLDGAGQYMTGSDAPPFGGTYDMLAWLPGDIIPDHRTLSLPPDLPSGEYSLQVGFYHPESGVRLAAVDNQGVTIPSQSIGLPSLIVEAN
jgi:hypothetical protein